MVKRKGIILAGGHGKRMLPCSIASNKQLFPVYDKPMVYYPLSTLMFSGIKDILIIVSPAEIDKYQKLLGDGSQWGIQISFAIQENPEGIAQAFLIAEDFIADDSVCLVLGDNIFYGDALPSLLTEASSQVEGATVFAYRISNPSQYGIISFDDNYNILNIEEKPKNSKSNYAVVGIYYYDNKVIDFAKSIKASVRGELEITDINLLYLAQKELSFRIMGRGMAWLDAGSPKSMLDAANFICTLEERQGLKICCPEEIAWRLNYITDDQLFNMANHMMPSDYGAYLHSLINK